DNSGEVTITIPRNTGGAGYVCYGRPENIGARFERKPIATTQVYEGAKDLDLKPAVVGEEVQVCRIFAHSNTAVSIHFKADASHWTDTTTVKVTVKDAPNGNPLASHVVNKANPAASFSVESTKTGFHPVVVTANNTPPQNSTPAFSVGITYTAPQTL